MLNGFIGNAYECVYAFIPDAIFELEKQAWEVTFLVKNYHIYILLVYILLLY